MEGKGGSRIRIKGRASWAGEVCAKGGGLSGSSAAGPGESARRVVGGVLLHCSALRCFWG